MKDEANLILGIEGTAHTSGIGIIDSDFNILADVRSTYKPVTGGIHPREASTFIMDNLLNNIVTALEIANIKASEIDLVAFSQGPGLGPCLRATATGARSLSLSLEKPLVGVNHPVAHIELGKVICKIEDPLSLYVSGGNTQIAVQRENRYLVLGETHDIAIGNLIDQTARVIGYDHALAGPVVEKEALNSNKNLLKLPYSIKGTTIYYSGLFTAAINHFKAGKDPKDICYSLQEYSFAMLAEVLEKTLLLSKKDELLITGGVAANKRLYEIILEVAKENNVNLSVVPLNLAGDNGIMIAITGKKLFEYGIITKLEDSFVRPMWRLDEAIIPW